MLPLEQKDSIVLAYLHLPVFLWVLVGLAFTGNEYGLGSARLAYLKFNGALEEKYPCTRQHSTGVLLKLKNITPRTGAVPTMFHFAGKYGGKLVLK